MATCIAQRTRPAFYSGGDHKPSTSLIWHPAKAKHGMRYGMAGARGEVAEARPIVVHFRGTCCPWKARKSMLTVSIVFGDHSVVSPQLITSERIETSLLPIAVTNGPLTLACYCEMPPKTLTAYKYAETGLRRVKDRKDRVQHNAHSQLFSHID
jgi:hypothetical protein